ncbi:MAG: hypothetical protein J6C37_08515 [Roseburia sp.]|nr:hypothetical protein [Roseburia sp.]
MKIDQIIDAIGKIKPEYVKEAEQWKPEEKSGKGTGKRPLPWKMKRLLPLAACLALVILGSTYGIWQYNSGYSGDKTAAESMEMAQEDMASREEAAEERESDGMVSAEDGGESTGSGQSDEATQESAVNGNVTEEQPGDTKIKINEVNELATMIACGNAPARQEFYTAEELEDYYGVAILPEQLPEDLSLSNYGEQNYHVAYNEEDKVMDDNNHLIYQNRDESRKLEITVWTVEMGETTGFANNNLEKSQILGQEVIIGHFKNGTTGQETDGYLAVYEKSGVNFTVQSNGLTEEEFISALTGLVR